MSNIIQGIKVGSTTYKYDYNSLENLPAPELPSSTQSDSGKILAVNSTGNPVWSGIDRCLPTYGSIAEGESKALMVVNDGGELAWHTILPASDNEDEGKVLVVNNVGEPEWGDLSGVPESDSEDEGKTLVVNSTGEPVWGEISEVPDSDSSDEGKALVVASNGVPIWQTIIPYSDSGDESKALVVNSTGEPVWRDLIPSHNSDYDGSDTGKVLTVATNGSLTWEEGGSGGLSLPDTSDANTGDVLIVDASNNSLRWGSPLPTYDTGEDIGKVLAVTANGPEWVMPS